MKRILTVLTVLLLLITLGCAAKNAPAKEAPAVTAPQETKITLRLPLGLRDGVLKTVPNYTAGFFAADGKPLRFTAASADPTVADCILRDDGTLYVIGRGPGETKLTITAGNASGNAASTVSVTVRDARRMLALLVLGALSAAFLILLGKPVDKKPEEATAAEEPDEAPVPVVLYEEPNDNLERSSK